MGGGGQKRGKIVLAEGTFDLLHYGHIHYLTNAKMAGGENAKLIVIVARDKTVERLKGRKPILPEDQRRAIVESLKVVDEAILGYEDIDMYKVIDKVKPDIIALGYDKVDLEKELKRYIEERGLNIEVIRISKFDSAEPNSSTSIRRKIIEEYQSQISRK
ncbi:MAG: adenylyltransferase/cytidyltransferase family protein [Candidatus Bathyarchaeia archaeon]|nr:FAD synthase [Candidatus Bathyarchaeota archaeon]